MHLSKMEYAAIITQGHILQVLARICVERGVIRYKNFYAQKAFDYYRARSIPLSICYNNKGVGCAHHFKFYFTIGSIRLNHVLILP